MTPDPTLIEQVASCPFCGEPLSVPHRVNPMGRCDTEGCWMHERAYTVVLDDPRQVAAWNTRAGQGSAALPSEAQIEAGMNKLHDTIDLSDELLADLADDMPRVVEAVYLAMRATTPTAPVQDDDAVTRVIEMAEYLESDRNDAAWPAQLDKPGSATRVATARDFRTLLSRLSPTPETYQKGGVPASPSGCQPSASNLRFSQSGIPNAVFIEARCEVGGCMCHAWDRWWWACNEADPDSTDEDRDPAHLTNVPFDPAQCQQPLTCSLFASVGRNPEGQDRETGLGRNDEHAVGAAEAPNLGSTPETGLVEALDKLRALRVMCESCSQPLYVEILNEALASLSNVLPDEV